jgi:hypothetical protein
MSWNWLDVLIVVIFLLQVAALGALVLFALRLKKPVTLFTGRIKPWTQKGKMLAETGKREFNQNKQRFGLLAGEVKGLAGAVRPAKRDAPADPRLRFNYRSILSAFALLRTLRSGLGKVQAARNPAANPPGPAFAPVAAKKKARPSRLGIVPDLVRLLLDVRRELRRG